MDIKILDSHLREYLDTRAKPEELAKYISLCGPTFDRTHKVGQDYLYEIEVTTNRVDAASVIGIAREASAILPQFGIKANFKKPKATKINPLAKAGLKLTLKSDPKLEKRLTAVVIEDIKNWESSKWMKDRLEAAGIRSLNAVVDITNYVMITIGHPSHAFDYDKIKDHKITVRESKKGEKVTSFDNKTYTLPGGDIVFEDINGGIIDLPGIIGTKNSVVSKDTKRVLFFFDNNDSAHIRQTSMSLAIRTMAASLNEKNVDPELINGAMSLGIDLFEKICKAKIASKVYDVYPEPYKAKTISTSKEFIEKILGIEIDKNKIDSLLKALEFETKWDGDKLTVLVPSFRAADIEIPEDIIEEIARIYGYHNLPSCLMAGTLPEHVSETPFYFENKLRQTLKSLGGTEILTYSLVSKQMAGENALRLTNPLGSDTEYLRTSLKPSLVNAVKENTGEDHPFHLFELAKIYLPNKNSLPEERMMIAGILVNYSFREAKGIVEAMLESLNINLNAKIDIMDGIYYYEYELDNLKKNKRPLQFTPIPKYPPQIEDITVSIPQGKPVGEVVHSIKQASKLVSNVELVDIYERNFTFRIYYQNPEKTLSDKEVENIREKIEKSLS